MQLATLLVLGLSTASWLGPEVQSLQAPSPAGAATPTFATVQVVSAGFEPRIAVGPDGTRWISTQDSSGAEVVYHSADGMHWALTPANPGASKPCCDNEIAVSPTGRVLTSIISGGIATSQLDIHYTDDGGRTWTASQGNELEDQDREWLAVGTKDPSTGQNDVYMLWHNLLSGAADHEMLVSTSSDNGANFSLPIPVALPGTQAWLDLQCADSGGPSNIFTNPRTGQVYAVFATRSSVLGGCGASLTGPEINIVAATRIWVATSTDQGLTWTDSLAVDDSGAGNIVGMQVNAGTLDDQGDVYVVYPESPQPYPNYDGAAVKYVWAPPDLGRWSDPVTVAPSVGGGNVSGAGHILTHIAAGDPGELAFFYLEGDGHGNGALWYPTVSETHDGLTPAPTFTHARVSDVPAWRGTASRLMGVCYPFGPEPFPLSIVIGDLNAVLRGFLCGRSSDVYGQALTAECNPTFVWYDSRGLNGDAGGTYVTEQNGGPSLCSAPGAGAGG